MSYLQLGLNTTYCPDTPKSRADFEKAKQRLLDGGSRLSGRIAAENRYLRSLSSFKPGYEPDRTYRSGHGNSVQTVRPLPMPYGKDGNRNNNREE